MSRAKALTRSHSSTGRTRGTAPGCAGSGGSSRATRVPRLRAFLQRRGGILELAVLEELLDQFAARVGLGILVDVRIGRQQHPALDLHQRRGHDQEVAGELDVELVETLEMLEELVGDRRDGDVENVHLVLLDEVEEQVERAVEGVERDGVGHEKRHPWRSSSRVAQAITSPTRGPCRRAG